MHVSTAPILRFSTADFPERDRLTMFREMFGRGVANMDITPLGEECRAEIEARLFPGASVMWGSNSAHRFEKSRDLGKSDDDCLFAWASSPGLFRHLGKQMTVAAGPAVLMSCADKATVENADPIEHVTLKLPRAALKAQIRGLEGAFMRPVPTETDALRLLKSYLATVRTDHATAGIDVQRAMVLHVCDLVVLALGATRDGAEQASGRGLRAARLDAMKKHALEQLSDPALTVKDIALRQRVSARYVQKLFEGEGTTFSSFLLEARLALAHRRLGDSGSQALPIGTIAADCGFGDLSYFNQSFRRRFGETPSDVRHRARRRPD